MKLVDEPEWQRPSPRLRMIRIGEVSVVTVVVLLVVVGACLANGDGAAAGGLAIAVPAMGAAAVVLALRRVRAWGYAERQDDLLVKRGVMFQRLSVVPYGRMQFIDVTAGPIERLAGLATVKLHTAAAASDARIPGLPAADAQRLRDSLAALGEANGMGL